MPTQTFGIKNTIAAQKYCNYFPPLHPSQFQQSISPELKEGRKEKNELQVPPPPFNIGMLVHSQSHFSSIYTLLYFHSSFNLIGGKAGPQTPFSSQATNY